MKHLRLPVVFFLSPALIFCLAGCSNTQPKITQPDTTGPEIELISPGPDEIVADTVRISALVTDETAVGQVTFIVDDSPLVCLRKPPWQIDWTTDELPHESSHHIQIEAIDTAGNITLSTEIYVTVLHNHPPVLKLLWPPDQLWLDLDSPQKTWRCDAFDPDESNSSNQLVSWFLDGELLDQKGQAIEPPPLSSGIHELRVTFADQWGKTCTVIHTITCFRFTGSATPTDALDSFLSALRTRNPERALTCLDPAFTLIQPGSGQQQISRETICDNLQALFADSTLSVFTVQGRQTTPDEFSWQEKRYAKIELRDFACLGTYLPPGEDQFEIKPGWTTMFSNARVFLVLDDRGEKSGLWRLISWWDLHGSYPSAATGPPWSEIIRSAGESHLFYR